jgi:hypothetical protein
MRSTHFYKILAGKHEGKKRLARPKHRCESYIKTNFKQIDFEYTVTYACPAWELAADAYLLKLQFMQNKVLRTFGNFPSCTPVSDLHTAFNLPCVYDYVIKLCRQQAEFI